MPVSEAEDLAGKVKDKNVSKLFENMDKMDIQLERRRTAEEKEKALKASIELCQEFGASKEMTVHKVVEKYSISPKEAEEKVKKYWKVQ